MNCIVLGAPGLDKASIAKKLQGTIYVIVCLKRNGKSL